MTFWCLNYRPRYWSIILPTFTITSDLMESETAFGKFRCFRVKNSHRTTSLKTTLIFIKQESYGHWKLGMQLRSFVSCWQCKWVNSYLQHLGITRTAKEVFKQAINRIFYEMTWQKWPQTTLNSVNHLKNFIEKTPVAVTWWESSTKGGVHLQFLMPLVDIGLATADLLGKC